MNTIKTVSGISIMGLVIGLVGTPAGAQGNFQDVTSEHGLSGYLAVGQGNFPDVPPTHWAYQAVVELKAKGIIHGEPATPASSTTATGTKQKVRQTKSAQKSAKKESTDKPSKKK